ncbi:uncharacterized protein LOC123502473 isoform X3 [Portunus trituberculatus]|uniref:uncharacterized protein LOC123502473 isoform X3 n=1 Tax=Portunus trituberculatus TaxID=210409 RepID=UPI001E1CE1C6|nr:uncharacterized protein LOC123502473 isoform X3 [Portunus trituberculatus]
MEGGEQCLEIHQPHHENRKQTSGQGTCREGQRSQLASREWVRMARLAVVVVVVVLVLAAAAAGRPDYTLSQNLLKCCRVNSPLGRLC